MTDIDTIIEAEKRIAMKEFYLKILLELLNTDYHKFDSAFSCWDAIHKRIRKLGGELGISEKGDNQ